MKLPANHVEGVGLARPTGYGGFGERMLRSMGWVEGTGLGAGGVGIKEAIQVKKKDDTKGIGKRQHEGPRWADAWWERAFDGFAKDSGVAGGVPATSSSSSSGVDESDTSSESSASSSSSSSSSDTSSDSDGSSEKRPSRVAAKRGKGPSPGRSAGVSFAVNRDGTVASGSAEELALLAAINAGSGRVAAGRFRGRDGKMARIRAMEAEHARAAAAKLGGRAAAVAREREGAEGASVGRREEAEAEAPAKPGAAATTTRAPAKARVVVEVRVSGGDDNVAEGAVAAFEPTPEAGWWGSSIFRSAGRLGGTKEDADEAKKRGFDEDDQTRIYSDAHRKKTQGRVGLGQGTRSIKIEGGNWEGKKTTFDEGQEGEDGGRAPALAALGDSAETPSPSGDAGAARGGEARAADGKAGEMAAKEVSKKVSKRAAKQAGRKASKSESGKGEGEGAGGEGTPATLAPSLPSWHGLVNWRKALRASVDAARGDAAHAKLKAVRLHARTVVEARIRKRKATAEVRTDELHAALEAELARSQRYEVSGKKVKVVG